ncbi:tRNA (guanosine(37)-N1)-methyltransferase TrmD [Candidatus Uhrbacteria bacterium]|nr:tRNA (guanosine(37)-N1)-methyltransferase TrmD [Candidatus Uhrbacteria bacterium]
MKKFHIVTIFPEVVGPYAEASILGRAQKKKLAKIVAHNLREYTKDKHRKVDDSPYGGGAGMVMTVQPFDAAVKKLRKKGKKTRVILTAASGKRFTQADARRLLAYGELIFLCGRYEGVDERVAEAVADESLSIGDYVLTGGELPALVMTDAVVRLIPGVLGNVETLAEESHGEEGFLEYPQYTKPEVYVMREGRKQKKLAVPDVLRSGDHARIKKWREEHTKKEA